MLAKAVKKLMSFTPYEIRRRGSVENDYDVIEHNSELGMDRLFSDPAFLAKYNSPSRKNLHLQTLKWIVSEWPSREDALVVGDFGCGPADFFNLMVKEYPNATYYGYDFSSAVLRAAAHGYPAGTYTKHDIYTTPPRQHDITICSQTLEHLAEPEVALKQLLAATKPGGILLLTVPNGRADTFTGHINFWSPESWDVWIKRNTAGKVSETRFIARGTSGGSNVGALIRN